MASSCNICCEYYNKSTRAVVKCCFGDCNFESCKSCVRKYLLTNTNDPHCMNCKKSWSQDFLTMNLNRSFVSQEYKEKKMDMLLEKEMSKMPQTMEAAEREKKIELVKEESSKLDEEIMILNEKVKNLNREKRMARDKIYRLRNNQPERGAEKKKFIMPCPGNDCRGFLSSQYKCEMCNMHTCPKCLVIIGPNKNVEHVCNEDMVKSAELIKQETKPCPSCGTRISKISGCNQMWCTNCHVAFSWSSGKIDNGPVHNPHFYEYQKNIDANGVAPRNPGDVVCGGMVDSMTLRNKFSSIASRTTLFKEQNVEIKKLFQVIMTIHRLGLHVTHVCLPDYRGQARDIDHNESLRVEYLLKKKTIEELRSSIYNRDYTRQKNKEVLYILELVSVTLIEMFAKLVSSDNKVVEFVDEMRDFLVQFDGLAKYCNDQLENISVSYNRTVPKLVYCQEKNNYCYNRNNNNKEIRYEWALVDHKYYSYSKKKKSYNDNKKKQQLAASEN